MADSSRPTTAANRAKIEDLETLVRDHERILVRGNGKPSLQEDVRRISNDLEEIKDTWRHYTRLVMGVLITQFILGMISGIYILMRLAPLVEQLEQIVRF